MGPGHENGRHRHETEIFYILEGLFEITLGDRTVGGPPGALAVGPRDIPPSLSFFQGVRVDGEGALRFEGSAGPGTAVELRIEMPAIAIVANVPHPLDPRPEYTATTLELLAWRGDPTGPEDALWSSTPELERAYLNTADYCDARGI